MQAQIETPELKEIHRYRSLLAATLHELDSILTQGDDAPDAHIIAKIRALRDTMQAQMPMADAALDGYVAQAMQHATFEILPDEGIYGEIPGIFGAYSLADTEEESRRELADVLREWVIFSQQRGLDIPALDTLGRA